MSKLLFLSQCLNLPVVTIRGNFMARHLQSAVIFEPIYAKSF